MNGWRLRAQFSRRVQPFGTFMPLMVQPLVVIYCTCALPLLQPVAGAPDKRLSSI